jgi:DNA-binding transcriptional LysR family regulator
MDLKQARTFVTVTELGTVSKAAAHLRIAQSALSRQISSLENELGIRLFDRVGRGLVLSAEGEQLLNSCRNLLSHADSMREQAQALKRGDSGVLRVAASPQFIEGALSDFLPNYAQTFPDVQVKLTEAIGWSDIRGLIDDGQVHLGQNLAHAVQVNDARYAYYTLGFVEQFAAYRPIFRLGTGAAVTIEALALHPLLLLETGYIFRRTFDAACRLAKVEPVVAFESRTPHTLLTMAEGGHGVAIIPSACGQIAMRCR